MIFQLLFKYDLCVWSYMYVSVFVWGYILHLSTVRKLLLNGGFLKTFNLDISNKYEIISDVSQN